MSKNEVFQFRADLKDYRPKMWRRFLVTSDMRLSDFAYAMMSMFNMEGSHLFDVVSILKSTAKSGIKRMFNEPLITK